MAKERALTRSRQRVDRARRRRSYPQPYYSYEELREMRAEARQRRRTRLIRASFVVPPLIAAIVVGVFAIRNGWFSGDDGGTQARPPTSGLAAATIPTARSVNDEGGYAFRHPTDWNVAQIGTRTELTDPSGDVSLSIDVAADGEGDQVLTGTLPTLTANWSLVKTEGPILRHVDGRPAVSVGGTGVAGGHLIRFLAIVIDGGDRNYLLFVSVPQERDPVTVTPQIEATVSSFELLTAG